MPPLDAPPSLPHPAAADLSVTERSRLRRNHRRGHFDRTTIDAILDATFQCHVGYVLDGRPMVTPTFQWREGDHVYWHGSSASRFLRHSEGAEVCLTVTLMDGVVLARSAMHHSLNYRSVMLFGPATKVTDPTEKARHLEQFVEAICPGRWATLRPISDQEVKATTILSMPITEGAAKIRTGPPVDDEEDYQLPIWAGVVPLTRSFGVPMPDPRNLPGVEPPEGLLSTLKI